MKFTIQDIADMAGVSRGTVSKVINKNGSLSRKTIEKVMKVIEETGYQPSFSAKALATQKSNLIGLIFAGDIMAPINHPFFTQVINAFKNAIGGLGYDMLMFSNNQFSGDSQDYLARCRHFRLDGCLIIAGQKVEPAVHELDQSNIPCIGVDIELSGPNSVYITTDNRKVSSMVVEHLYLNNIREVGFIGGPERSSIANTRKESFLQSMGSFGMTVRPEWIHHGDYFEDTGYEAMQKILASHPLPKAVYAVSDMMGLGAMKAMKEHGLSVPDDMLIIGCDDIEACRYSDPPLATVKQDKEKLGKLSAYMLHDLISGKPVSSPVLVDPELLIRESCMVKNNIR